MSYVCVRKKIAIEANSKIERAECGDSQNSDVKKGAI